MNLAELVEPHPPSALAVISRGRSTTYGELREQAAALRGGLVARGLEPGDRLAVICANNWYFAVAHLAALGAGLVSVPINPTTPAPALERELSEVGVRAVVVGPSGRSAFEALRRDEVPSLELVVGCGFTPAGGVDLDELLAGSATPLVPRDDHDPAVLSFTSGTAGAPRAAVLSNGNLAANLHQLHRSLGLQGPDDVVLGVLPFFHVFGLQTVLGSAWLQGSAVLAIERFDPTSAIEAMHKHGVTQAAGPPTMWAAWAGIHDLPADTFAGLRVAASGAAKLPVELGRLYRERFGLALAEGYGLTEAGPVVSTTLGTDAPLGSVGVPLVGVEVRVVDEAGHDVLVGDQGELWVRGPNVFGGYWGDPEASGRALTADGWLRTGDVGLVDDDGYLHVVDRLKDLIIVSGFNVFPAEVEEVLAEHGAIADVAVVGVPHPHTGEAVKAFVVVRPGASIEEDDVIAFAAARLPRYKCPAKVNFVEELPHGLAGKLLRRQLRSVG